MYLITQLSQYCSMAVKFGEHSTLSLQNYEEEIYQVLIEQQNLLIFCVPLVCTCRISGAKVQLFAYNKFGQKINSASHV
jgi:hypothetical protein